MTIKFRAVCLLLVSLGSMLTAAPAFSGTTYSIAKSSFGGIDVEVIGGPYRHHGTFGQWEVGAVSGGGYTVCGGFWCRTPPPPPCPADLSGDGFIDSDDLFFLLGEWGSCEGCASDIVGSFGEEWPDGWVDSNDLFFILGAWGPCS